jgi:hypothetical protein
MPLWQSSIFFFVAVWMPLLLVPTTAYAKTSGSLGAEAWTLAQLTSGQPADLNRYCDPSGNTILNIASNDTKIPSCHFLSGAFVKRLLLDRNLARIDGAYGIQLSGAVIKGDLDFDSESLPTSLILDDSEVLGQVLFGNTQLSGGFVFSNSLLQGAILGFQMHDSGGISIVNTTLDAPVALLDSEVDKSVSFSGSTAKNVVDLENLKVGEDVSIERSNFQDRVILENSLINGNLNVTTKNSFDRDLSLTNTSVGGESVVLDSSFVGPINAASMSIKKDFIVGNVLGKGGMDISYDNVGDDIEIISSKIGQTSALARTDVGDSYQEPSCNSRKGYNSNEFSLDACNLVLGGSLKIVDGTIVGGNSSFLGSQINGGVGVFRSNFLGGFELSAASADDVYLNVSKFFGSVDLSYLRSSGELMLNNSYFGNSVLINDSSIGSNLLMQNAAFMGPINLSYTNVGDRLSLTGANLQFTGTDTVPTLIAVGLSTAQSLEIDGGAVANGAIDIVSSHVGTDAIFSGSHFKSDLRLDEMSVGRNMDFSSHSIFDGNLNLSNVQVTRNLFMKNSSFQKDVDASYIDATNVFADGSEFYGNLSFEFSHISGILDLRANIATSIDLSNAAIGNEFITGGEGTSLKWACVVGQSGGRIVPMVWPLSGLRDNSANCGWPNAHVVLPKLILRDAYVHVFQDSIDAWPSVLDLVGFKYDLTGGFGGDGSYDMSNRTSRQWLNWLERDKNFSTQPYEQLASVLISAGQRDAANDIEYDSRFGEMKQAFSRGHFGTGFWLFVLWGVAGFGIGSYTFIFFLAWIVVLTLIGAGVLWCSPVARSNGFLWCAGASLDRLLPIVDLYQGFKNFFENPPCDDEHPVRNLKRWQVAFFAIFALLGWVLAFFFVAAMTGLTQRN